jgi:diketogulonate reductase-like aldo/keto reductase
LLCEHDVEAFFPPVQLKGLPLSAAHQTTTDCVMLGKSGVKVTRVEFGTGSFSGPVQRDLGQDGFTRLVRYAYDSGIRFFKTAESFGEMHRMLGAALKGIPPDSYRLMREDRKAAMRLAFKNAGVDGVTVGYKNTAEIDETIENLNLALASWTGASSVSGLRCVYQIQPNTGYGSSDSESG